MEKSKRRILYYILGGLLCVFATVYHTFIDWATNTFGITLREILYTVLSPMVGADTDFLGDILRSCILATAVSLVVWTLFCLLDKLISSKKFASITVKAKKKISKLNLFAIARNLVVLILISSVIFTTAKAERSFKILDYITSYIDRTTIYETHYVDPDEVTIEAPEKRKNLIHIYLESMETTYASKEEGGYQPSNNYIPNLTRLAKSNISFSNSKELGGFMSLGGTTWTMASLFSTTAGIPFSFPVSANDMDQRTNFAQGVTALGDILHNNGYVQQFLCGSDGNFGGRKKYFEQHGNYNVYDIYSAKADEYIPEDYFVWWGYEDSYLYEIAKKEITKLSKNKDAPFNFTFLTVDTHHVDGYVCDSCSSKYDNQLENVITCADKQIYKFIEWCKRQPFYDDTVIVITGDHPRMDNSLVDGCWYFDRTIYNCFINTDKDKNQLKLTKRIFTAMDVFPTILSALNFKIEGDKLGLGTDMFSKKETLAEIMGIEKLQEEVTKYSKYYINNFS